MPGAVSEPPVKAEAGAAGASTPDELGPPVTGMEVDEGECADTQESAVKRKRGGDDVPSKVCKREPPEE